MNIPYITPPEAGFTDEAIEQYFADIAQSSVDLHSTIMIKQGKIFTERYFVPYNKDKLHRMYSVTKSFVSLAIGALAAEGKLKLDDLITDYFPEYPTEHKYTRQTTIRDMLMMRSAHDYTTYKQRPDLNWVESFFTVTPTHKPGTVFAYDTSASHTLGALAEKLAQMPLLDYLRKVCLDEIGFSKEAYCLKDPQGVSIGGSGLMAKPMDIARLALLLTNGGKYNGRQLLPEEYIKTATAYHSRTKTRGSFTDECQGYGMQFWQIRDGWMMYGMAGQLALVYPEKELILITTADSLSCRDGVQVIINSFRDNICGFKNTIPSAAVSVTKKTFSVSCRMDANKNGFKQISLQTNETGGKLEYKINNDSFVLPFGIDKEIPVSFPGYGCECMCGGTWVEENRLIIKARLTGEMVGSVTMEFYFDGDSVTLSSKKTESHYFSEYNMVVSGKMI